MTKTVKSNEKYFGLKKGIIITTEHITIKELRNIGMRTAVITSTQPISESPWKSVINELFDSRYNIIFIEDNMTTPEMMNNIKREISDASKYTIVFTSDKYSDIRDTMDIANMTKNWICDELIINLESRGIVNIIIDDID